MKRTVKIGIVGCGFVSEYYMRTMHLYQQVELVAVTDLNQARAKKFADHFKVKWSKDIDDLLDEDIELVINLTDPENHFEVSKAILMANKHLYSEKPLTLSLEDAKTLEQIAKQNGVFLSGAPCTILGPSAQTLKNAIETGKIGKALLVHVEMDDGPIYLMNPDTWRTPLGVPWPYESEFHLGSSFEHLGYPLSWIVSMFGSVTETVASSHCLVPNKMEGLPSFTGTDYSVAILKHKSGVVSRLTCGIVAPMNRGITITGEKGSLYVEDIWDNNAPVWFQSNSSFKLKAARKKYITRFGITRFVFGLNKKRLPMIKKSKAAFKGKNNVNMDYMLGIADLCDAILKNRNPVLSSDLIMHINELTLAINYPKSKVVNIVSSVEERL